ncbi:thioesterase family protein [Microbulbifer bruguierae]|uniref:Thioesterase family protein n=1 Tax=Microbulbifer bruguierae TaxID=3029061 RepID=A0ABY8NHF6_9GAMM|nr:thioesterase family protein [Microbulbifer bruguierae]WGL18027.1 thioesterase family protein [Microbulbifer bruguierae]
MNFSSILSAARGSEATVIPAGWGQGRATFGGLVAAVLHQPIEAALEQATQSPQADTPLRSLTISFVAPAAAGSLQTSAQILRAGRSAVQIEARASQLQQSGEQQTQQVVTAALASFGKPRASAISIATANAPVFAAPETCQALPYIEGLVPEFTRHFDYRLGAGALPFTGSLENRLGGWIRFRESAGPVTTAHLLALIDAWPPAVLPMLKTPAPASSLTWTVEMMPAASEVVKAGHDSSEWWQYLAEVEQADDGYGVIQARLWDGKGQLLALSRQTVSVFG